MNLGNPSEFTIMELAEQVIAKCNSTSEIKPAPLPGDDPKQRQPDITLAIEKLGWRPTVALSHGLDTTIDYFRGLLESASY